jgi:hypothetical protein
MSKHHCEKFEDFISDWLVENYPNNFRTNNPESPCHGLNIIPYCGVYVVLEASSDCANKYIGWFFVETKPMHGQKGKWKLLENKDGMWLYRVERDYLEPSDLEWQ